MGERTWPRLRRFLTRRDKPWPLVREAVAIAAGLALAVALLYVATGQPLSGGYPVVVVTTGSMMHCENGKPELAADCDPERWGRLGAIDPGDLIFVVAVDGPEDIETAATSDAARYGGAGDVIVYRRDGVPGGVPVIHRALFWIEPNGDGTFDVPEFGASNATSLPAAAAALAGCTMDAPRAPGHGHLGPEGAGFVTRGDNNHNADQCTGSWMPARPDWILGKARGEVPWVGVVNLLWGQLRGDRPPGCPHGCFTDAGTDSKAMAGVVAVSLVGAPWVFDALMRRRRRRRQAAQAGLDKGPAAASEPSPKPDDAREGSQGDAAASAAGPEDPREPGR